MTTEKRLKRDWREWIVEIWRKQATAIIGSWLMFAVFGWMLGLGWLSWLVFPAVAIAFVPLLWIIITPFALWDRMNNARRAAEFADWPRYTHPLVGDFEFDWKSREYRCQTNWAGQPVTVSIPSGPRDRQVDDEDATTIGALFRDAAKWKLCCEDNLVDNFLDVANEHRREGEARLTREEFLNRLKLTDIAAREEGEFEIYYSDGGLFGGHSLLITGSIANGLQDATEVG